MFSYILPAAGKGTRLNLPYPKEIHRVHEDHSLIDFSLNHIRDDTDDVSHLTIVVTEQKQIVFDYVQSVLPDTVDVKRCYFNDTYTEWPGSILSAEHDFADHNIVLLPDSVVQPHAGHSLLAQYKQAFSNDADIVFAYCPENDPKRLTALGALDVVGPDVIGFEDKPDLDRAHTYNGFWASFAFTKRAGPDLLKLMMKSVAGENVKLADLGYKVSAFPIANYQDLGTWPSMNAYLQKYYR